MMLSQYLTSSLHNAESDIYVLDQGGPASLELIAHPMAARSTAFSINRRVRRVVLVPRDGPILGYCDANKDSLYQTPETQLISSAGELGYVVT